MSDFQFTFTSLDLFSNGSQTQQQQQTQTANDEFIKLDSNAPELVLLAGPPCSGRTFYYYQHYRATHIRISATELFQKDRELSFRSIIQNRVLRCLQEGKNVVVDDPNHMKSIRESYLQALIKSETPVSRVVLLNFIPSGGELQIQWALAWAHCERSMVEGLHSSAFKFKPIDYVQFKAEYQTPIKKEGYNWLKDVTTPLFFNQHCDDQEKELSNIALFLDVRAIARFVDRSNQAPVKLPAGTLRFQYDVHLHDSLEWSITQWISNYPKNGPTGQHRIILLIDEVSLFPASIDYTDQITVEYYRKELRKVIKQLSDSICYPVYYYYVPAMLSDNDFYRFPNPGLLAIAQYRHRLSLQKSIVVVNDDDPKLASSLPFNVILASKFFQESTWSIESKISKNLVDNVVDIPSFLESIQFVNYDDIEGFVVERGLPMFSKLSLRKNEKSTTEECLPSGKRHGVYFPHDDYVQRQQRPESDQVVFEFDFDVDDVQPNVNSENGSSGSPADQNGKPLPWVDNRFMVEYGIDSQSVYRGDSYYREARLINVELSHFEPDYSSPSIAVRAQCKGTTPQPYFLLIRYRMKGNVLTSPILDTQCNCPNGVRTYGKCKHIVALFYHCNAHFAEKPIQNKLEELSSNTPIKRKLPEWMAPGKPTTQHSEYKKISPQKKTLNLYFPENESANSGGNRQTPKKHGRPSLLFEKPSSPHKSLTFDPIVVKMEPFDSVFNSNSNTSPFKQPQPLQFQQAPHTQPDNHTQAVNSDLFIQQLFGNSSKKNRVSSPGSDIVNNDESRVFAHHTTDTSNPLIVDNIGNGDSLPPKSGPEEFCVPRTNSEEFLRSVIQKDFNSTHEPTQSFSLMSSQDDPISTATSSPTTKKKISLKQLLESQGIQIQMPTTTSSPPR